MTTRNRLKYLPSDAALRSYRKAQGFPDDTIHPYLPSSGSLEAYRMQALRPIVLMPGTPPRELPTMEQRRLPKWLAEKENKAVRYKQVMKTSTSQGHARLGAEKTILTSPVKKKQSRNANLNEKRKKKKENADKFLDPTHPLAVKLRSSKPSTSNRHLDVIDKDVDAFAKLGSIRSKNDAHYLAPLNIDTSPPPSSRQVSDTIWAQRRATIEASCTSRQLSREGVEMSLAHWTVSTGSDDFSNHQPYARHKQVTDQQDAATMTVDPTMERVSFQDVSVQSSEKKNACNKWSQTPSPGYRKAAWMLEHGNSHLADLQPIKPLHLLRQRRPYSCPKLRYLPPLLTLTSLCEVAALEGNRGITDALIRLQSIINTTSRSAFTRKSSMKISKALSSITPSHIWQRTSFYKHPIVQPHVIHQYVYALMEEVVKKTVDKLSITGRETDIRTEGESISEPYKNLMLSTTCSDNEAISSSIREIVEKIEPEGTESLSTGILVKTYDDNIVDDITVDDVVKSIIQELKDIIIDDTASKGAAEAIVETYDDKVAYDDAMNDTIDGIIIEVTKVFHAEQLAQICQWEAYILVEVIVKIAQVVSAITTTETMRVKNRVQNVIPPLNLALLPRAEVVFDSQKLEALSSGRRNGTSNYMLPSYLSQQLARFQAIYRGNRIRTAFQMSLYKDAMKSGVLGAMPGTRQGHSGWYQNPKTLKAYYFDVNTQSGHWRRICTIPCSKLMLTSMQMQTELFPKLADLHLDFYDDPTSTIG